MIPAMTSFKEALSAPALYFKRLRLAEPLLCNGSVIVRRTYSVIETEIYFNERHFLLFLPFSDESVRHIEELEYIARDRSRGPLIENRILREELSLFDSLGNKHSFDVILQELPSGVLLKDAVNRYRADDLRAAVLKMKQRLDAIGFCHHNLNPSNVIICNSGVARPLRYWYAEWETFSNNDISKLTEYIDSNSYGELDAVLPSLLVRDCEAEYEAESSKYDGIKRCCKCHRYGFVDNDGRQITPFVYSWASDFCEGRAIVADKNKMGVIDSSGRKILSVSYESVKFDVETGCFTAIKNGFCYLKNYEGETISRTKIVEPEEYAVPKESF